jgi:hypothetical protein
MKTKTFCDLNGEELDVLVYFDASGPEPDVNWPGDFEITTVMAGMRDITDLITPAEMEQLEMRVKEDFYADNSQY